MCDRIDYEELELLCNVVWRDRMEDMYATQPLHTTGRAVPDDDMAKKVDEQLVELATWAINPAFRNEENRSYKFCEVVRQSMTLLQSYPKVQEEGLRFYRNMSADNPPIMMKDKELNFRYLGIITEALRLHPGHLNIQLHGMVALDRFCRLSREAAHQVTKHNLEVVLSPIVEFPENDERRRIANKLYWFLRLSNVIDNVDYDNWCKHILLTKREAKRMKTDKSAKRMKTDKATDGRDKTAM